MNLVLFEDALVDRLWPITLTRPAFAITCGGTRLFDLLKSSDLGKVTCHVRPYLRTLQYTDCPGTLVEGKTVAGPAMFVNARLVPSVANLEKLRSLPSSAKDGVIMHGSSVVVAWSAGNAQLANPVDIASSIEALHLPQVKNVDLPVFDFPHDVIRHHMATITDNLNHLAKTGPYKQTSDGLFLGENVRVAHHVVVDTRPGPVIIESGAAIGPFVYLRGPVYIGRESKINEHAAIKEGTCLGHTTKVGGEVDCSIIEPLSNKQHYGFLGHSYVGSWVNIGAGTCNSDLKNTYGPINMTVRGQKVETGMQFIGCFIGDYAKTAVNTSIFTGKTIGVASMLYGVVTTNVPSFVNYAKSLGQNTEAPVDVVIAMQARMFNRRKILPRPCDVELLRSVYEMTRDDRRELGTLSKEPLTW
jgi:glucose-1-phosphate thymidylyltransferase